MKKFFLSQIIDANLFIIIKSPVCQDTELFIIINTDKILLVNSQNQDDYFVIVTTE